MAEEDPWDVMRKVQAQADAYWASPEMVKLREELARSADDPRMASHRENMRFLRQGLHGQGSEIGTRLRGAADAKWSWKSQADHNLLPGSSAAPVKRKIGRPATSAQQNQFKQQLVDEALAFIGQGMLATHADRQVAHKLKTHGDIDSRTKQMQRLRMAREKKGD